MRVNVSELLADRDGARVLAFAEPLPAPGEDVSFVEPVTGELVLTGSAGGVSLRGRVRTVASCVCGACLRRFPLPIAADVTEQFGPRSEAPEPDAPVRELVPGDFLVPVEAGDMIDVTEVVRQHVVLALPLAPRCREDCPGLCPRCGADLNDGPCDCEPHDLDPRLDALRRWRAGPA
ncbi:MAG TPA: DUF177 domain-containing protein [bacterium]|nr:DUF177 domain-containing protein [bacterium]